jgi:hypothetical protein
VDVLHLRLAVPRPHVGRLEDRSGRIPGSDAVGRLGLEPRTDGLKVRSSTIELTPLVVQGSLACGFTPPDRGPR